MLEAVFISDLHLNPDEPQITARFNAFIDWALNNTRSVYVLGDLFHVWAGDDGVQDWSLAIAQQFRRLADKGISLYFMPGNRDFLLGKSFAQKAGFHLLSDPSPLRLHDQTVLLAHGDAYCLLDKAHQRFRRFTRNSVFIRLFLSLPLSLRQSLVAQARQQSQKNQMQSSRYSPYWDVVPDVFIKDMQLYHVDTLIHGHTHKPGIREYQREKKIYRQFVLSDWDDFPKILGYNKSSEFNFVQIKF